MVAAAVAAARDCRIADTTTVMPEIAGAQVLLAEIIAALLRNITLLRQNGLVGYLVGHLLVVMLCFKFMYAVLRGIVCCLYLICLCYFSIISVD